MVVADLSHAEKDVGVFRFELEGLGATVKGFDPFLGEVVVVGRGLLQHLFIPADGIGVVTQQRGGLSHDHQERQTVGGVAAGLQESFLRLSVLQQSQMDLALEEPDGGITAVGGGQTGRLVECPFIVAGHQGLLQGQGLAAEWERGEQQEQPEGTEEVYMAFFHKAGSGV